MLDNDLAGPVLRHDRVKNRRCLALLVCRADVDLHTPATHVLGDRIDHLVRFGDRLVDALPKQAVQLLGTGRVHGSGDNVRARQEFETHAQAQVWAVVDVMQDDALVMADDQVEGGGRALFEVVDVVVSAEHGHSRSFGSVVM